MKKATQLFRVSGQTSNAKKVLLIAAADIAEAASVARKEFFFEEVSKVEFVETVWA